MTTKHYPPGYDHSRDIPQAKKEAVVAQEKKPDTVNIPASSPKLPRSLDR